MQVSPNTLKKARFYAEYTNVEDAVKGITSKGIKAEDLKSWENAQGLVNIDNQKLMLLASNYGLSLHHFIRNNIPQDNEIKNSLPDFRGGDEFKGKDISQWTRNLKASIEQTKLRQEHVKSIVKRTNPEYRFNHFFTEHENDTSIDIKIVANKLQQILHFDQSENINMFGKSLIQYLADSARAQGIYIIFENKPKNFNPSSAKEKNNIREFKGFCINDGEDEIAPFIFINSAQSEESQIFTLIHEITHIVMRHTGLCNYEYLDYKEFLNTDINNHNEEKENYCNQVAEQFILSDEYLSQFNKNDLKGDKLSTIKKRYRIPALLLQRRYLTMHDNYEDDYKACFNAYSRAKDEEQARYPNQKDKLLRDYGYNLFNIFQNGINSNLIEVDSASKLYGNRINDFIEIGHNE